MSTVLKPSRSAHASQFAQLLERKPYWQHLRMDREPSSFLMDTLRREAVAESGRWWVLKPEGTVRVAWDCVAALFIMSSVVIVPFVMGFDPHPEAPWQLVNYVTDVFFAADIIVNFCTGYRAENARLVMAPRDIARNYLTSWFAVDVLAILPTDLIFHTESTWVRSTRLLRLLRLVRLAKLARVKKFSSLINTLTASYAHVINEGALMLLRLVLCMLLAAHLLACLWFALGSEEADSLGSTSTVNWIRAAGLHNASLLRKYSVSLYYVLATMATVGYGDVVPQSSQERLLAVVVQLVGASLYGYVVGATSLTLHRLDLRSAMHQQRLDTVNDYARFRKLPRPLWLRLRRHTQTYLLHRSAFNEDDLLAALPASVRAGLQVHARSTWLRSLRFVRALSVTDPQLLGELARILHPYHLAPGEVVFRTGDVPLQLYFVLKGSVRLSATAEPEAEPDPDARSCRASARLSGPPALATSRSRRASLGALTSRGVLMLLRAEEAKTREEGEGEGVKGANSLPAAPAAAPTAAPAAAPAAAPDADLPFSSPVPRLQLASAPGGAVAAAASSAAHAGPVPRLPLAAAAEQSPVAAQPDRASIVPMPRIPVSVTPAGSASTPSRAHSVDPTPRTHAVLQPLPEWVRKRAAARMQTHGSVQERVSFAEHEAAEHWAGEEEEEEEEAEEEGWCGQGEERAFAAREAGESFGEQGVLGRVLRPYSARAARPTEALFAHAADVRELAERWPALAEHLRTQSGGVVQELREWRERVAAKQEAGADALHHTQPADAAAEGSMDGSASSGLDSWEGSGAGSGIAIATHWQASALPLTSMPALEVEGGSGDASPVTPAPRSLHQRLRDLLGRRPRESVVTNAAHRVSFAQAVPVRNSRPRAASPSPASPGVRPSGQVRTPASVASAVSESTPTEQSFGFLRRRSRRSTAPPCRVRPTAPGKLLWDVVMAVQALLVALAAPLRLSLRLTNTPLLLALDAVTDVWFAADMALTFFTGVPDKQETIVWSARAIARQYVTSWLLFDCLSLLPLLLLLVAPDAGQPTVRPLAVTLQLLRLLRLSRLTRVLARFRRAAEMVPPTVVQVCKLLATLLMVAHVMTCAWLAVTDGDVEGSWLHTYCVEEGCNATPAARYLTALYWTITTVTTTGYGDVTPGLERQGEVWVAIASLVVGCVCFSYALGATINAIRNLDPVRATVNAGTTTMRNFLMEQRLPAALTRATAAQYRRFMAGGGAFNEEEVVRQLPAALQCAVMLVVHRPGLEVVHALRAMESVVPGFIGLVGPSLLPMHLLTGAAFAERNDPCQAVAFVLSGRLEVLRNDMPIRTVPAGHHVCEAAVLSPHEPPRLLTVTVVAGVATQLLVLPREAVQRLADHCPSAAAVFEDVLKAGTAELASSGGAWLDAVTSQGAADALRRSRPRAATRTFMPEFKEA